MIARARLACAGHDNADVFPRDVVQPPHIARIARRNDQGKSAVAGKYARLAGDDRRPMKGLERFRSGHDDIGIKSADPTDFEGQVSEGYSFSLQHIDNHALR